jgi:hypothetical protein
MIQNSVKSIEIERINNAKSFSLIFIVSFAVLFLIQFLFLANIVVSFENESINFSNQTNDSVDEIINTTNSSISNLDFKSIENNNISINNNSNFDNNDDNKVNESKLSEDNKNDSNYYSFEELEKRVNKNKKNDNFLEETISNDSSDNDLISSTEFSNKSFSNEYINFMNYTNISKNSLFFLNLNEIYYYDYGPVLINGSFLINNSFFNNLSIELVFNPKNNKDKKTKCTFNLSDFGNNINNTNQINNSNSLSNFSNYFGYEYFYLCELNSNLIDISKYDVTATLRFYNYSLNYSSEFDLMLRNSDNLKLSLLVNNSIEISETQNFIINLSKYYSNNDSNEFVSNASVGISITSPSGVVYSLEAINKFKGIYEANFYSIEKGTYTYLVTAIKDSEYKTYSGNFDVVVPSFDLEISIDNPVYYTGEKLVVEGNLSIFKNKKYFSSDIDLIIFSDNTIRKKCNFECDGSCVFRCEIDSLIELGDYELYAELNYYDNIFSSSKNFKVEFSEPKVVIEKMIEKNMSLQEPWDYKFKVYDIIGKRYIIDATTYASVIDPDNNVYRFNPILDKENYYSFDFVSLISGLHNINITAVKQGIFVQNSFNVFVNNSIYNNSNDYISRGLIQVPAEVDKKVRWIREVYISNKTILDKKIQIHKDFQNLKIDSFSDDNVNIILDEDNYSYSDIKKYRQKKNYNNLDNSLEDNDVLLDEISDKIDNLNLEKTSSGALKLLNKRKIENFNVLTDKENKIKDMLDDGNLISEPILDLSQIEEGYHVISYETDAPIKEEKKISKNHKLVTISSENHYRNVLCRTDISESRESNIKLYWLKDSGKQEFNEINYIDSNQNGLIDSIEWVVPHLSNQTFEIIIYQGNESTDYANFDYAYQYDNYNFLVKPDWNILENDSLCNISINNKIYEMNRKGADFDFDFSFDETGILDYYIVCGNDKLQEKYNKTIEILPPIDIFMKRNKNSKTYYVDNLLYLTESSIDNKHYYDGDVLRNIDAKFYEDKKTKSYIVDKGNFLAKISNAGKVKLSKNGYEISYEPLKIVYRDLSNESLVFEKNINYRVTTFGNKLIFENYFDGIDLVYSYENSRFKQEIKFRANRLPIPLEFNMNEDEVFVYLVTEQSGMNFGVLNKTFKISGVNRISNEFYLEDEFYYYENNKQNIYSMQNYYDNGFLYSGVKYSEIKEGLVLDPVFSIISTSRDAMGDSTNTYLDYYNGDTPYLLIGSSNGENYESGVQFSLDVPINSTIVSAFITITPGTNTSGVLLNSEVLIENSSNANEFDILSGNLSQNRNYYNEIVYWNMSIFDTNYNYTSPDVSSLIQLIVNRDDWSKGNYISFLIKGSNESGLRSINDYSTPLGHAPTLTVIYLSDESRPNIELVSPQNATQINNNSIIFSYIPDDEQGLDTCELWGNFTGVFKKNISDNSINNNSINEFVLSNLNQGKYIWNIWCNDTMGNYKFNLYDYDLIVDRTSPIVNITSPSESDEISDFDTLIEFSYDDDYSENATCDLYLDNQYNSSYVLNNSITKSIYLNNLTVGNHDLLINCSDIATNYGFSELRNFSITRFTNLTILDDTKISCNYSMYELIGFYANYTDINDNSIEGANCSIVFDGLENINMFYDSGEYVLYNSFNESGYLGYQITCSHPMYDLSTLPGMIYIYPKTNASIRKKVLYLGDNDFLINILYKNEANYSSYVEIVDFVHNEFNVTFDEIPSGEKEIVDSFFGKSVYWKKYLDGNESGEISYTVSANQADYKSVKLYMLAFVASDSEFS